MIDGYAKLGNNAEFAECLFNQMLARDIISWTTMMNCYSRNKRYRDVLCSSMDALCMVDLLSKAGLLEDALEMV
ncbi:hypothetical protein JHK87_023326 [Glycine soja]|nr:hypothetical protein JHK87_023326 [Glycine soja]